MKLNDLTEKELLLAVMRISAANSSQLENIRHRLENVEKMVMNVETEIIDSNKDLVIRPRINEIFNAIRKEADSVEAFRSNEIIQESIDWVMAQKHSETCE